MTSLLRSSSVRLALGYAAVFILSSLALAGLLWWRTASYLDRETDAVILANQRAVAEQFRASGLDGAMSSIRDRVANGDKEAIYLLVNPIFEPLEGNLGAWPAEVGYKPGWFDATMFNNGEPHATRLLSVPLPGGLHLLIGRDVEDRARIRAVILNGLAWAVIAALVIALGGAFVTRRALSVRIELIRRTAAAIVQGDLGQRIPGAASGDEFDQLTGTINQMLEQIQALLEGVRNVSNAVAHDLRTPLAEARARLEDVLRLDPAKDVATGVEQAVDDIDRVIAMSNALLRLAEIDSGVRRSGFRAVDLAEVATEVVELYLPMAEGKSIALTADADGAPAVRGDPFLLAQALGNLIDNAIKYTPPGGRIGLRIAVSGTGEVVMSVTDNGPGIAPADKAHVTERFYRGDASRGTSGVGLGLSLVAAIARLHGGALTLADANPGLSASMRLPLS
jgi:signal transduction histidine kinase